MGTQYKRAMALTLGGQTVAQLADNPDDCPRVRFKFQTFTTQAPNKIQVIVSNLSSQSAQNYMSMIAQKAKLVLTAGYLDNSGIIFQGDTSFGINGRESPTDTTLQLFAEDGSRAYDYAVVNKALSKGSTPKDHFDALAEAMSAFGVTAGSTPSNMTSPQYPRGVTLSGMAKEHLRTLAASTGNTWSIQMGQLQMTPVDGSNIPGAPYVLNSSTGLIGMPTQTFGGIMIRCLINPAINLVSGSLVQVDQSLVQRAVQSQNIGADAQNALLPNVAADGLYRILYYEGTGDTRGNDWYLDLSCVAKNNPGFVPTGLGISSGTPTANN